MGRSILYYVSGHGYGHASRSVELMNALAERDPSLVFHIRTLSPPWMYGLYGRAPMTLSPVKSDVGALQKDPFHVNVLDTLKGYESLEGESGDFLRREESFSLERGVVAVIGDIPALAFRLAARLGLPSVALGNFSWDWIYAPYVERFPEYAPLIEGIREDYARADLLLRLPFSGDLSAFRKIVDLPLIVRRSERERGEVLHDLGLKGDGRKIVLVTFGGLKGKLLLPSPIEEYGDYFFICFARGLEAPDRDASRLLLPEDHPVAHYDILSVCDAVVSKPGYGIVSECIAHRKPLLYTSRDDFVEYPVLVKGIEENLASALIPRDALVRGAWMPYLDTLMDRRPPISRLPTDGAERAAESVLAFLQEGISDRLTGA